MSRYSVDIDANLHGFEKLDAVESQINKLNGSKIKIEVDTSGIQDALKNIKIPTGSRQSGKSFSKQFGQDYIDNIKKSITEYGNLTTKLTTMKKQFEKLNKPSKTMNNLQSAVDSLKVKVASGETTEIVNQYRKVQDAVKDTESELKQLRSTQSLLISDTRRLSLANTIEKWNQKNTAATKECISTNEEYIRSLIELNKEMSRTEYDRINQGFKQNENSMRGLGKLGASLRQQMSDAASSFTQWISVSGAIMTVLYQVRQIPQEVYKIDTAMTNLYKVTDETQSRYDTFLDNAGKKAQKLGTTMSDLINQTADWTKLGYSLDEAEELSKLSSIYQNVGEVDSSTAVSDMVTAMKAFNIEASNAVTIIDQLNALGNNFATSSADLGTGLTNSASAMATAGDDIQHTLAMLTGGAEITQNAGEFGNFLKVASMRVRGK